LWDRPDCRQDGSGCRSDARHGDLQMFGKEVPGYCRAKVLGSGVKVVNIANRVM